MIPWWAYLIGMVLGMVIFFFGSILGAALVLGGKKNADRGDEL